MRSIGRRLSTRVVVVVLAVVGVAFLARVADSDSSITVTLDHFTLTCPANTVTEGATLTCTLANTSAEAQPWPVVAILHLSSDEDRALVRGALIDAMFDDHNPATEFDGGVEWIGDTLVGYSRFDWSGAAGADPSTTTTTAPAAHTRTVSIVATHDGIDENGEAFYVSLGPDGSRGVGLLYSNRQRVAIADNDAASSNNEVSSLILTAVQNEQVLSVTEVSHSVTFDYGVTEVTLTAEAVHARAAMTLSVSHGGSGLELDGRGGTSLAVLSGEESVAVPLAVGATTLTLTVIAEDGAAKSYRIAIVRQELGTRTTVAVSSGNFTLTCPAEVNRGLIATCALVNAGSGSAPWPVVAAIHSSADRGRALVAEDPIIPDTDPTYVKDVSLGVQDPEPDDFNHGYGELFSGGSRTVYRTYGYEKFDWTGDAAAGASRDVAITSHNDPGAAGSGPEVFYVALAPSGYTGFSRLVDNKAPVMLLTDPTVSSLDVESVAQTSATVTARVSDPDGSTLYLRHRPTGSSGVWTSASRTASATAVSFSLTGLTADTSYTVQASFDSTFPPRITTIKTFTTQNRD